ncbi:MAG: hypothetical protein K2X66_00870 [Cyanobacteria bacterium]|nr:hypothetical protein [Cyanobacteriota bacterium]
MNSLTFAGTSRVQNMRPLYGGQIRGFFSPLPGLYAEGVKADQQKIKALPQDVHIVFRPTPHLISGLFQNNYRPEAEIRFQNPEKGNQWTQVLLKGPAVFSGGDLLGNRKLYNAVQSLQIKAFTKGVTEIAEYLSTGVSHCDVEETMRSLLPLHDTFRIPTRLNQLPKSKDGDASPDHHMIIQKFPSMSTGNSFFPGYCTPDTAGSLTLKQERTLDEILFCHTTPALYHIAQLLEAHYLKGQSPDDKGITPGALSSFGGGILSRV